MMNEIFWGTGFLVYSAVYGRISTESLAAVQVTSTTVNLFQVAAFGMASAAAVMIGHKVGSGEEQKGLEYAWRFVIIAVFTGIILGGLMAVSARGIVSLFNVSDVVRNSAVMILYMTAIIFIIRLVNIIAIVGLLRGGGDATFAFIAEALTMWLVGVPMSLLGAFVLRLEVQWVVLMIMAEEVTKLAIIIVRMSSKKWIKNVVKDV
jgi:Na+-driven multidrug efflux pump